jgi:hypothetical protein
LRLDVLHCARELGKNRIDARPAKARRATHGRIIYFQDGF